MTKKNKTGFFGKLFGGNKSESCCTMELEEATETPSTSPEEPSNKHPEGEQKKEAKRNGCCNG